MSPPANFSSFSAANHCSATPRQRRRGAISAQVTWQRPLLSQDQVSRSAGEPFGLGCGHRLSSWCILKDRPAPGVEPSTSFHHLRPSPPSADHIATPALETARAAAFPPIAGERCQRLRLDAASGRGRPTLPKTHIPRRDPGPESSGGVWGRTNP